MLFTMDDSYFNSTSTPNIADAESSVLLFGPQVTTWTQQNISALRRALADNPDLDWLRLSLMSLGPLEHILSISEDEELLVPAGLQRDISLIGDIASCNVDLEPQPLSNTVRAPLTVAFQFHYLLELARSHDPSGAAIIKQCKSSQGFCLGFLTAAAFSLSKSRLDFERNANIAIRLATLIGAVIDAEDAVHSDQDTASVIAVRCTKSLEKKELDTLLDAFPNAYISCVTDELSFTITLPIKDKDQLLSKLTEARIAATVVNLQGSYHTSRHEEAATALKEMCASHPELQLPTADRLRLPLRSTASAELIATGNLNDIAIDSILSQQALWYQTVRESTSGISNAKLVPVGPEPCVPRSLLPTSNAGSKQLSQSKAIKEIAVVGMGCRFPQADSVDELWELISSGRTAIGKIPEQRFQSSKVSRQPKLETYWGNFIDEPDVFDHRFFGISGREARSMDPQQRLALQVAYEALESAGYHGLSASEKPADVGCYMGVGSVEYELNVASEDANAFSATGTLRAFISGRISHYYGWSGPSLTLDTACSSSAVAIHTACRAILGGECSMALAGGVNIITSPTLHQNLSGASFLNPNGSSKAFDADANGYCRGEGAGMLVLKPLTKALSDHDHILGVIAGSAINQNSNCSSITVPDSSSQSNLYTRVLSMAGLSSDMVDYVEAHGTGTNVGDPIEFSSIQSAFKDDRRKSTLYVGSLKDNIGHTEAASGVAGVMKTILMIQRGKIPKQANFVSLNPRIKDSVSRKVSIPTATIPWTTSPKVALVNNYGAAGSNTAILVREHKQEQSPPSPTDGCFPVTIAARSKESLKRYVETLSSYLSNRHQPLSVLAHNISKRQNPSLSYRVAFTVSDLESLANSLKNIPPQSEVEPTKAQRPVILSFGGQVGNTVCLSKALYDESDLLQKHINHCNSTCGKLGLPSIIPQIFSRDPVDDIVLLHCMLFSLQYSSAKSWIESGLNVDALIGHSFGQIVALCVADSISLEDGIRFIAQRALLIRERWNSDPGAMLAVECSPEEIEGVISRVASLHDLQVDIACYNGPRSFVLSGNTASIQKAGEECAGLRVTKLSNTHAYHSYEADAIIDDLMDLAQKFTIRSPRIHVETCSKDWSWKQFSARELVQHTRQPVYFYEAVQRISSCFPSAIWLEAGSSTPIVAMARRVLQGSDDLATYQPLDIGGPDAKKNLSEAVCRLWMLGTGVKYWGFHSTSNYRYNALDLPPYAFEKHRQWIELRPSEVPLAQAADEFDLVVLTQSDQATKEHVFTVKTSSPEFGRAIRGHAVAGLGLCPASLYVEIASIGAIKAQGDRFQVTPSPHLESLVMSAPLSPSALATVTLRLREVSVRRWEFSISSLMQSENRLTEHANGVISLGAKNDVSPEYRLSLLQKIAPLSRADRILGSNLAQGATGNLIYKIFGDVVDYADYYHGVKRISVIGQEVAAIVALSNDQHLGRSRTLCDPIALDNFLQVAGIHVNCFASPRKDQVFMATSTDELVFSEAFMSNTGPSQRLWHVYSHYEPISTSILKNNIFVYDPTSQSLVLAIIGATFRSVPIKSLTRTLSKLGGVQPKSMHHSSRQDVGFAQDSAYQSSATPSTSDRDDASSQIDEVPSPGMMTPDRSANTKARVSRADGDSALGLQNLAQVISNILEIPINEVKPGSTMDELGIDSLVATELLSDLQKAFNVSVSQTELQDSADVGQLLRHIEKHQGHSPPSEPIAGTLKPSTSQDTENRRAPSAAKEQSTSASARGDFSQTSVRLFRDAKLSYDRLAESTNFAEYYDGPYQLQSRLVLQYLVEALSSMGVDLASLKKDEKLPDFQWDPRHTKLMPQLMRILQDGGLVDSDSNNVIRRTGKPIPAETAMSLHHEMLAKYPQHASETKLLHATGPKLASCLLGTADPIALIFKDAKARTLLEDVYANAPMFKTGTLLLGDYLASVVENFGHDREVRILEIGAGTGGTTSHLTERLVSAARGDQSRISYTFTDVSPSLVAAARRKFAKWEFMQYAVLDIEKEPPHQFLNTYDVVISTNCIHATKDLVHSTTNIRKTLKPDGMLCLVELTRNLFWFDLVFGLLEGWWLFTDGRQHALASEELWESKLQSAGFTFVDWTSGATQESSVLRVITAWQDETLLANGAVASPSPSRQLSTTKTNGVRENQETLVYKKVNGDDLLADIYYPSRSDTPDTPPRPVALMIHGGGHVMLSRRDIRPKQTQLLLDNGFLPVSIDYRLCPEMTIIEGPMRDVADAYAWVKEVLPQQRLQRPDIRVDEDKTVVVGWSTGGHLAMSVSWTSSSLGTAPPDAILTFYNPSDYEDPCWMQPNIPDGSGSAENDNSTTSGYPLDEEIRAAVHNQPITSYNVSGNANLPLGGWLAPRDPRSRLLLYMNWKGRTLHVLLNGLSKTGTDEPAAPEPADVAAISPLAQIRRGAYRTPTFMIHTREDDLLPWAQAERTHAALRAQGVDAELRMLDEGPHLFDIYPRFRSDVLAQRAVLDGYRFLCERVGFSFRER
ncbi:hypothetical protein F4808DRAFT_475527, partial [Astrocystis sublimbata]